MLIKRYQQWSIISFIVLSFLGIGILSVMGYNMGINATSGYTKIHPLFYFAIFLAFFRVLSNNGKSKSTNIEGLSFIGFTTIILIYLYISNNLYSVSFIVDTFICPVVFWMLFKDYNVKYKLSAVDFAVNLAILNSIIAVIERVFSYNFFPISTTYGEIFRSTALLGHPLNNALITFVFILYILSSNMVTKRKMFTLFILIASLLCFGARGCLYCSVLAIFFVYVVPIFFINNNYFKKINKSSSLWLLLIVAIFSVLLTLNTPIGERLMDASFFDENADVRVQALNVIDFSNLEDYLWAKHVSEIDMITYNYGVNIVENFFIVWILKFGLVIAAVLFLVLYRFLYCNISINNKIYRHIVLLLFFLAAATNNSLSTNTQVLAIFLLLFCNGTKMKTSL